MNTGQSLREARSRLGLTLESVSDRTGIATSAICEFEKNRREPKLVQLQKLARVYRRPVGFFLDEQSHPIECVLWCERPAGLATAELQATFIELAERYHSLEILCDERSPYELPFASGKSESFSYSQAESLAFQVRKELGLGDRPGQTLLRVLEEVCNVKVFHLAFDPTGLAACSVSESFGTAVLLNADGKRWHRNFELAHQLFHLLTWKVFRSGSANASDVPSEHEEQCAASFARNLLMPAEAFKDAISIQRDGAGKLGFDRLFEVAREFDVSVEAVMWQMCFVFHLDRQKAKEAIDRTKASLQVRDTREPDQPPRYPSRYIALCNQAFRKGLMSTGRYAECLGISRRHAMRVLEQNAAEDVEVEFAHP